MNRALHHDSKANRLLHQTGWGLGVLGGILSVAQRDWRWAAGAVVGGFVLGVIGHLAFEPKGPGMARYHWSHEFGLRPKE